MLRWEHPLGSHPRPVVKAPGEVLGALLGDISHTTTGQFLGGSGRTSIDGVCCARLVMWAELSWTLCGIFSTTSPSEELGRGGTHRPRIKHL